MSQGQPPAGLPRRARIVGNGVGRKPQRWAVAGAVGVAVGRVQLLQMEAELSWAGFCSTFQATPLAPSLGPERWMLGGCPAHVPGYLPGGGEGWGWG